MFGSEERRIVRRIKDFIKDEEPSEYYYIMLRNGRIPDIRYYLKMLSDGKINPSDAFVYINIDWDSFKTDFYYPFLDWHEDLLDAYLSKLGLHYGDSIVPATGLKYAAFAGGYRDYLSIELVNLDTVVNNTNLRKIVVDVLDGKLISGEKMLTKDEYDKIYNMYKSQHLIAGRNFDEADTIIFNYYDKGNQSLAKEAVRIAMDYDRIFNPYRVCYETKTWKEVDCWKIKLD